MTDTKTIPLADMLDSAAPRLRKDEYSYTPVMMEEAAALLRQLTEALEGAKRINDYVWQEAEERYGNVDDWKELPDGELIVKALQSAYGDKS